MKKGLLITGGILLFVFVIAYNFCGLDVYLLNKMNTSTLRKNIRIS
jgi:hypothetical protein